MKVLYVLMVFSFGGVYLPAFAQGNFAPLGAEWYYTVYKFGDGQTQLYQKYTCIADTLVAGKMCRQVSRDKNIICDVRTLTGRGLSEFMYEDSGRVYFWDFDSARFQVLYDFNAKADDRWNLKVTYGDKATSVWVTVDDAITENINGLDLRVLYVTYDLPYRYTSKIIERIGDMYSLFNFAVEQVVCDDDYIYGLRCYSDTVLGNYSTGIAPTCTYTFTGINELDDAQVKVYPNPVEDRLLIQAVTHEDYTAELSDITGRVVLIQPFRGQSHVPVGTLPAGLYLVTVRGQQYNYTTRIAKQ